MSRAKELLEWATPMPWAVGKSVHHDGHNLYAVNTQGDITSPNAHLSTEDAALIVYAVNHLPDYLAAVEALERLANECLGGLPAHPDTIFEAHAALARLRDEVPA